jgi:hypothetical protein
VLARRDAPNTRNRLIESLSCKWADISQAEPRLQDNLCSKI